MKNVDKIISGITDTKQANECINGIAHIIHDRNFAKIPDYIPWMVINASGVYDKRINIAIYQILKEMLKDKNFQMYKDLKDGSDITILEGILDLFKDYPTKADIKKYTDVVKVAITNKDLAKHLRVLDSIDTANAKKIFDIIQNRHKYQIPENKVKDIISMFDKISMDDYKSVLKRYGYEKVKSFSDEEFKIAVLFNSLYKKSNINEIPIYEKKKMLNNIIFMNSSLFYLKSEMVNDYPLLPKTKDEYCELLPTLVRSLGIETKYVHFDQLKKFNHSLSSLSKEFGNISEKDQNYVKTETAVITNVMQVMLKQQLRLHIQRRMVLLEIL